MMVKRGADGDFSLEPVPPATSPGIALLLTSSRLHLGVDWIVRTVVLWTVVKTTAW